MAEIGREYDAIIFSDDNAWIGFARYAGAYRIATELRNAGFRVRVIDFFASYSLTQIEEILRGLVGPKTLFIGFATSLWVKDKDFGRYLANSYDEHLKTLYPVSEAVISRVFELSRELAPDIKFVVGGSKAESLRDERIDHWVIGQGEAAIVALSQKLQRKDFSSPKILEGQKFPYAGFTKSKIDWTSEDLIFAEECLPIELARGCIFRCSFCYYPLNGKKRGEYIKSEADLLAEILDTHEKHGTKTFLFTDDLVNDSLEKVEMIDRIARAVPFKMEWSGFCRLDLLFSYPAMIPLLKSSGLRSAYFGIETLHQKAGIKSGKGLGKQRVLETLQKVKEAWGDDIMINAGFIVGLPDEPLESVVATLEWLQQDDCPIDVADVGVLNIKNRPDLKDISIYNSRIGESPESFGIVLSEGHWKHDQMDSHQAFKLVDAFYRDPRFIKKKRGSPFTMYPRLKNLGYSYDAITKVNMGDLAFRNDAVVRRESMFRNYFEKLQKDL